MEDRGAAQLDPLLDHDLGAPLDRPVAGEMTGDRPRGRPGRSVLAVTSVDGRVRQTLSALNGKVREPVWGPFTD